MLTLVLSIIGCFLGLCGFLMGAGAVITVIGWSRSTHKIEYIPPTALETLTQRDLPPGVEAFLPSDPANDHVTPAEYARRLMRAQAEAADYDE